MAWYWYPNRQVDQWYRIEDMDTNPKKYNFLILDKHAKNMQWRKDSLFNKWGWKNWKTICNIMKLNPYLSPCTKLNLKWIKDHGIRLETLYLIEVSFDCMLSWDLKLRSSTIIIIFSLKLLDGVPLDYVVG